MDKRTPEFTVGGKAYPLNFSVRAAKEVTERYGDISQIGDAFQTENLVKTMEESIWLLALMMNQGIARRNLLEGKQEQGVKESELEVLLDASDMGRLRAALMDAMTAGMSREVELEVDPKNGEATQS